VTSAPIRAHILEISALEAEMLCDLLSSALERKSTVGFRQLAFSSILEKLEQAARDGQTTPSHAKERGV
jgi:hypothetical protein